MNSSSQRHRVGMRRPELFTCLALAALVICMVMFSSVVSLPPEHIDASPGAHIFQNHKAQSQPHHKKLFPAKEIFSIRSVLNGKYIWCGDEDKILASTDTSMCLSERSFEVVVVDEANEWIALRLLSIDRNKRHRYIQVGPPPALSLRLAPKDISIDDHSIHFRIETVHGFASHSRAGHLFMRSVSSNVGVVSLAEEPFGAIHGHFDISPEHSKDTIFIFETVTIEEIEEAVQEEKLLLVEDEKILEEQASMLKKMFQPKQKQLRHGSTVSEKWVISFGMYGSHPKYMAGALRNVQLQPKYFPNWICRFYHDDSVPAHVLKELRVLGAEFVNMQGASQFSGGIAGMFWRFLVADDRSVDRFIIRDIDSRLNPRDALCVAEWVSSGAWVHSIRDHPNHDRPFNGGMWGARRGFTSQMTKATTYNYYDDKSIIRQGGGHDNKPVKMSELIGNYWNRDSYGADQSFLQDILWPTVTSITLSHDAYTCEKYPHTRPIPVKRPRNFQHVGQVFDASDQPRMNDIDGFIRGVEAPKACRKKPDWIFG